MRRQTKLVAALTAGLLVIGCTTVAAVPVPNPDPCDAKYTSNTIANLRAYDDCRFDRIEQGIPGNQTVTVTPAPVTVTETPDPVTQTVTETPAPLTVTTTVQPLTPRATPARERS